jgi:hypothetical protein
MKKIYWLLFSFSLLVFCFLFYFYLKIAGMVTFHFEPIDKNALVFLLFFSSLVFSLSIMFLGKSKNEGELKIYLEVGEDSLREHYSLVKHSEEILKKYLKANVLIKEVEEKSDEPFSYKDIPRGEGITLRLTSRYFSDEMIKYMSHKLPPGKRPFGITIREYNSIVISIPEMMRKLKDREEGYTKNVLQKTTFHEFYHLAGGKDDPNDIGIANPELRYDITPKQLNFIRNNLRKLEKELYKERLSSLS